MDSGFYKQLPVESHVDQRAKGLETNDFKTSLKYFTQCKFTSDSLNVFSIGPPPLKYR